MNATLLHQALRSKQWADDRTLDAAARLAAQGGDRLAFVLQQLNHMVIVEELFRARLTGQPAPHPATNSAQVPPLATLAQRLQDSDRWLLAFCAATDEAGLARQVTFRFTDGQPGRLSVAETLFHLVNHGSYHRGAIAHALDLSQPPHPADTYTVFIHAAEPERRWPG